MVQRLVFGTADFAGRDGVIVDAETAAKWGAASRAKTWDEFARAMYGTSWAQYARDAQLEDEEISGEDPFDVEEWVAETWEVGPLEAAFETASARLAEIIAETPDRFAGVEMGGASPGGNIDAISGPVDELAALSIHVSERDGFTLERDDDLVALGLLKHLYG